MDIPLHPRLRLVGEVADELIFVAQMLSRAAARGIARTRPPRNATLRPGAGTPMWNALVLAVRPHLRVRGAKINLGRELGLPPQRIHEFFVARTAAPDAERTLVILHWLSTRPPLRTRKQKSAFSHNM
jgi:hypothetical protein